MKDFFCLLVVSALIILNRRLFIFRARKNPVVLAVFATFGALPVHAALVDFSFTGEISAVNTSDVFLTSLFPVGTSGSGHLVLEYDGDPSTAVIHSFTAMLGPANFSMSDDGDHEVHITDDEPHFLELYDRALFNTQDVMGPSFFGYSAGSMYMGLEDRHNTAFSSDMPSATELTQISGAETQYLTVFFDNNFGENAGGVVLRPTDHMVVSVISTVPLPGALGLFVTGLIGLGAMSRRKKIAPGDRYILS